MQTSLRKLFFIAVLLAISATAYSMVIRGTVVDEDGVPVEGASVRLLQARDSSFVAGVATNSKEITVSPI